MHPSFFHPQIKGQAISSSIFSFIYCVGLSLKFGDVFFIHCPAILKNYATACRTIWMKKKEGCNFWSNSLIKLLMTENWWIRNWVSGERKPGKYIRMIPACALAANSRYAAHAATAPQFFLFLSLFLCWPLTPCTFVRAS